jgi:hypothetical protein
MSAMLGGGHVLTTFNFREAALRRQCDVKSSLTTTLQLRSGCDIVVRPMSFRSTRGTTLVAAICDELAWWTVKRCAASALRMTCKAIERWL